MRKKVILSVEGLTKRFPGVLAVNNVSLDIRAGEVHSIVGGNGAGKSTLMKMLAGVYPYGTFEGNIKLNGEVCKFNSVLDAQSKGIIMIPQELNMANELSVAENLFIGKYPVKYGMVDYNKMYQEAEKILADFDLDINPKTKVGDIGIAQKQLIVIARAMHNYDAKILLLDEPTATLSDKESKILFEKVEQFKQKNIACIYISHKLEEVRMISDVITVMRDGKIVGTSAAEDMSERKIISLMLGRETADIYPEHDRTPGEVVLSVKNITIENPKVENQKIVDNVSFDLRKGEILSMYGLVGAGRTETALALLGAYNGAVVCEAELYGKPIEVLSPADAVGLKIGYLPEDRKRHGVIDIASVGRNISISILENLSTNGVIDAEAENEIIEDIIEQLEIKTPSADTVIRNLSGGNAQKCVLGRWIAADSEILILDEATQGIDVGAKAQIYAILDKLAKWGKSILFISSDLSEVMAISDRILTMKDGKVINITDGKKAKRSQILWEATIGKMEEEAYE